MFWQRESEIKYRLYGDYVGKARRTKKDDDDGTMPDDSKQGAAKKLSAKDVFTKERWSTRVGHLIPESPQALTKLKYDWLEMGRSSNLGPPTAMTTVVANGRTSEIKAHVECGPCARPNAEHTMQCLIFKDRSTSTLTNACVQTASYLRRRRDFESVTYKAGYDGLRGRITDRTRRREGQKRGHLHDHFCEFAEVCGLLFSHVPLDSVPENAPVIGCRSCSKYCLRSGSQCQLSSSLDGNLHHLKHHSAPVTAELCRPWPLGTVSHGPASPPDLRGQTLKETQKNLFQLFWTDARCRAPDTSGHEAGGFHEICEDTFVNRLKAALALDVDGVDILRGSPCTVEDLVAAFYYRTVQTATSVIHTCKIGYCRSAWNSRCKRHLPWTSVENLMRFDDEIQRIVPQRRNLADDARVNTHSLSLLLRTGMNIQVNLHHPDDALAGLSYQLKYNLKPEPQTQVEITKAESHDAVQYLHGQFLSASQAAAFVLEDPITDCTRNVSPVAIPSWTIHKKCQGVWRRYCIRLPYHEDGNCRYGYNRHLRSAEVHIAMLFARFQVIARYLGEERDEAPVEYGSTETGAVTETQTTQKQIHPQKLNRCFWDDRPDDPTHPCYNAVLSELLPGERFILTAGRLKTDAYRRLRNAKLQFARFWEYDLSTKKDVMGIPARTNHFKVRLFKVLPWWSPDGKNLITVTPLSDAVFDEAVTKLATQVSLSSWTEKHSWMPATCANLLAFQMKEEVVGDKAVEGPEHMCRTLEDFFWRTGVVCECCMQDLTKRCLWCTNALGWHLCQNRMYQRHMAHDDPTAYVWCRHSLYHSDACDTDVAIWQMMDRGAPQQSILDCIEDLRKNAYIDASKYKSLIALVLANTGKFIDDGELNLPANELPIVGVLDNPLHEKDPHVLLEKLVGMEKKLQCLWDFTSQSYKMWSEFVPPRAVPSQYLAFDQLRLRFLHNVPILASIVVLCELHMVGYSSPCGPSCQGTCSVGQVCILCVPKLCAVWFLFSGIRPVSRLYPVGVRVSSILSFHLHSVWYPLTPHSVSRHLVLHPSASWGPQGYPM